MNTRQELVFSLGQPQGKTTLVERSFELDIERIRREAKALM
jgi:hypothetical protein